MSDTLQRFAVHTQTTKPLPLDRALDAYAERGFGGVSVWREAIAAVGLERASDLVARSGLSVPALVRGGFFCSSDAAVRAEAVEENRRCIEEAAAVSAEMVVIVPGAEPGLPLHAARSQVRKGLEAVLPAAEEYGVRLAIEPLHPMYAGDKACVNTMSQARALWAAIDSPLVGVALDVYHVWWDADLEAEIMMAGAANRLFGFHVCDWRVPTRDLLTDRALMGDGCIDIASISAAVYDAGFDGLTEVEIFSEEHWSRDQGDYLDDIAAACLTLESQTA